MLQFTHQVVRLQYEHDIHFGDDTEIIIPKVADLARRIMYLYVEWPQTSPVDDSVGTRMIEFLELRHANSLLERQYGESMEILNDLEIPTSKQQGLQNLVGKGITSNLASYHIRIPLSMNLPLCSLETEPILRIKFRPSNEFSPLVWTQPIQAYLFVDYVWLTEPERNHLRSKPMDYLCRTIQRLQYYVGSNETDIRILTQFTRPVSEFFWVIHTDGADPYDYTNQGSDQLSSLTLEFGDITVIRPEVGIPMYLRVVQALDNHSHVPSRKFYMYSFSLDPENRQPAGHVNMSDIPHQLHILQLTPCPFSRSITVYAVTHSITRVHNGYAQNLFDELQEA